MELIYILGFVYGCVIGSFLSVVIDRLPNNESIVKGRSYCDHCHKKLTWFELFPILSFLIQKVNAVSVKENYRGSIQPLNY